MNRQLCTMAGVLITAVAVWIGWKSWTSTNVAVPLPDLSFAHGDVARAVRTAAEKVSAEPNSVATWGDYGSLLFAHHFRPEATICFEVAAQMDPDEIRWPYYLAYMADVADLEAAVRWYRQAIDCDPKYYQARIRLARVLLRLGRSREASYELETALQLAPDSPYVLLEAGRLAALDGDHLLARTRLESAVSLTGWYPRVGYVELSRVCTLLNDPIAAIAAQQAATRLPETGLPEVPDPLLLEAEMREVLSRKLAQQADMFMASGQWQRAIAAFDRLAQQRPELPRTRLNLARCYFMIGDFDGSIGLYRDLCQELPLDPNVRFSLALACDEAGQAEQAIIEYQAAIRLKPDYASAYFNLGLIHERDNNAGLAIAAYRSAVESDPTHAPAHLALGVLLQKSGRPKHEYLPHLEAAVQLVPGDPVPRSFLDKARDSESP